ncbi:MAG: PspC domain-containing protein [Actinomycetota bacterium]|nr:PspC domain-containing protein [Actinomycetota bacterium]
MTTTDESSGFPPPTAAPPSARVLRRSRTDRVGAGVSGGLGEYFGVDPVLFRVLFATAAFFGGAGVLAYVVAWAAIPEQGTTNAPIDRFIGELRRRQVPVWLVAAVAGLVLWGVAFSWWAPGPVFPVMVIVIVLVAIFGRRGRAGDAPPLDPPPGSATVNLAKAGDATPADPNAPTWVRETRQWITEARAASRLRRRRALPVRLATLGTLGIVLTILALIDAARGVALPVYFWTTLGVVVLGLLVGMVLRRTPWTLTVLLLPALIGVIGFAGSHARLHDGFGAREWSPSSSSEIQGNYRLAFGQAKLDLRHVGTLDRPRTIHVTLGAGQARILLPATMNATVEASVHAGDVELDGSELDTRGGFNLNRTIRPPADATGPALTIDVGVSDGQISVERG